MPFRPGPPRSSLQRKLKTISAFLFRYQPRISCHLLPVRLLILPTSQTLYIGIAVAEGASGTVDVGFASHDGTYSIDFAVQTLGGNGASAPASGIGTPGLSGAQTPTGIASGTHTPLPLEERPAVLADHFVDKIRNYQREHRYKFVGAGLTRKVVQMSPQLPARLWWELDIVPLVFDKPL
jgi:hypothetical protein